MPNRDRLGYLRGRWAAFRYWIARNRSQPPAVRAPPQADSESPQVPGFADYYVAVASAYRPRRYPGSADFFVSDSTGPRWESSWRYVVRGVVSIHRVPGVHFQILSPDYAPALANALRTALQHARENARPTAEAGHTHACLVS